MRRAVTKRPGVMAIEETGPPVCGPGQARIAVEAVGLCGSDYHLFDGTHPYARFPQTQGHEFSGCVLEFGDGYDGPLRPGDRVAVEPLIWCGTCFACRRGRPNCCARLQVMGAHVPGALAEQVVVAAAACYQANGLDAEAAALVEPVSIALQAVQRGQVAAGDQVLILGAGPIGVAAALAAVDAGARVAVADRVASRLAGAARMGAELTVDTAHEDLAAATAEWTGGDGAAVVIDATGAPSLIRAAFGLVAPSGAIVIAGISDQEVAVPVIEFSRKEVTVAGSRNNAGIFGQAVDLVRRYPERVTPLITHRFGLAEAGAAIAFGTAHPELAEKIIITVGDPG
jgi:L-gulonate 5-dehydrogenase